MQPIPFLDIGSLIARRRTELDAAYNRVMKNGRFILGPELVTFEANFAAYCGTREAVGVGCGLDALVIALQSLDITAGDHVLVPAHTFIATWLAVLHVGAIPVPVEPSGEGFLPDASAIEAAITDKTRAVLVVYLYGELGDIEKISDLCEARGLPLIEDAAQAHGARINGRKAGNFGTIGCFSFYPSKNLGALGDAGAIVTNNAALAERARKYRNYGSSQRYVHDSDGCNSRLDELQAAFLSTGLQHLDDDNAQRHDIACRYHARLEGLDGLVLPDMGPAGAHVWHIFAVRTPLRDALQAALEKTGCQTLIHYPLPAYRHAPCHDWAPRHPTRTDKLTREILSLPMGPHMTIEMVDDVCERIQSFFRQR